MLKISITRYQPTQLEQNLYTKGRAAKLLKTTTANIEFIYPMAGDKVAIALWDRWELTILTKKDFLSLFVADRKKRSVNLKATQDLFNEDIYRVRNLDNNNVYRVDLDYSHLTCECQDYDNQVKNFGSKQVACKHVYAVLNQLGYGSLKHYLQHQNQRYIEPQYNTLCMAQGHY